MTSPFTIVGAFAFGLIASGHCLLMCGGIAGALGAVTTRRTDAGTPWSLLAGYQLGRITSYAVAGVLIGSIGAGIVQFVDQESVRIALRWLTALVFAALALNLLRSGRGFDFALGHSIWARLAPFARRFVPVRTLPRAFALGALWGWMPCGLVYSVLIVAALGTNPLQSGAIMFAFGLGTVPAVLAGAFGAQRAMRWLGQPRLRTGVAGLFFAFAVLTASGPWIAAHGMAAAARWLPFECTMR